MIDKGPEARAAMGAAGREKMEQQFDERLVIEAYLSTLRSILAQLSVPIEALSNIAL